MSDLITHESGAFRYLPGGAAYSVGAIAQPGWQIVDVEFVQPQDLDEGLERIVRELHERALAPDSLVGIELRSPRQVSTADFRAFNSRYLEALRRNGLVAGANPLHLARTNVVSTRHVRSVCQVQRFQLIEPSDEHDGGDFVISGCADPLLDDRPGESDDSAFRDKVASVIRDVHSALARLGLDASMLNRVDVYTDRSTGWLDTMVAAEIEAVPRYGAHRWLAVPPINGLEFEIAGRHVSNWQWRA